MIRNIVQHEHYFRLIRLILIVKTFRQLGKYKKATVSSKYTLRKGYYTSTEQVPVLANKKTRQGSIGQELRKAKLTTDRRMLQPAIQVNPDRTAANTDI